MLQHIAKNIFFSSISNYCSIFSPLSVEIDNIKDTRSTHPYSFSFQTQHDQQPDC